MSIKIFFEGGKKVSAEINGIIIKTDQPVYAGGEGSAPAPFDLFLASIGTCAGFYVKQFCDKREINTDKISLTQEIFKNPDTRMIEKIDIKINLPADFPEKYKDALVNAADLCAVKKHLLQAPEINVSTVLNEE